MWVIQRESDDAFLTEVVSGLSAYTTLLQNAKTFVSYDDALPERVRGERPKPVEAIMKRPRNGRFTGGQ